MKILIIDDDRRLATSLKESLIRNYAVDTLFSGRKGSYQALTNEYDLIILDLNLPDMNGLSVCQELRQENLEIPILILTGEASETSTTVLLNAGADDYVVKPFSLSILKARIAALLRRKSRPQKRKILMSGDLTLNPQTKTAFYKRQPILLTKKEFLLLEYFLFHPGQILDRLQLAEHIWEGDPFVNSNTIDVHVYNLRNKINPKHGKQIIKTVHGSGYILVEKKS